MLTLASNGRECAHPWAPQRQKAAATHVYMPAQLGMEPYWVLFKQAWPAQPEVGPYRPLLKHASPARSGAVLAPPASFSPNLENATHSSWGRAPRWKQFASTSNSQAQILSSRSFSSRGLSSRRLSSLRLSSLRLSSLSLATTEGNLENARISAGRRGNNLLTLPNMPRLVPRSQFEGYKSVSHKLWTQRQQPLPHVVDSEAETPSACPRLLVLARLRRGVSLALATETVVTTSSGIFGMLILLRLRRVATAMSHSHGHESRA